MRKSLYAALVAILIVASFLAGLWFNNFEKVSNQQPPAEKPATVDTEKRNTGDTGSVDDIDVSSLSSGTVTISPEKQQMVGVRTGVVEKSVVAKKLRLLGRVAPDETRIFKVNTSVDGIIREVYPSTTGSLVKKDQPLASFYSPDIYAAEQDYLIARSSDRYGGNLQVLISENRLRFLGMSKLQIEELKKTGKLTENVVLSSPETGFVLVREVSPDLRFQKGKELYRIAALDRVWIYADIYESEGKYVRPHGTAKISHPQLDKKLDARVSGVLPLFDAGTRTLKVRLETDNPGFVLRPDMFVDIELPISIPDNHIEGIS
jgi:Cu(I)/Ag(I) efflux system membrane fusion protein